MTIAVPDDISFEDLGRIIDISIGADDEQYGNTGRFRVVCSGQLLVNPSMKTKEGNLYSNRVPIMTLAGVRMEYIPDGNGASRYLLEWLGRAPAEQIPSVIGHCDEETPGSEDVNRRLREGWHRTWDVIPSETLERITETFRTVDRRNPYHYYDTSTGRILSSKKDLRPEPNLVRIRTWKDRLDRVLGATFSARFCRFGANLCDFNIATFEGSLAKLGELERWRKVYTDAVRGLTIAWAEANCLVPEVPESWGRPAQPPGDGHRNWNVHVQEVRPPLPWHDGHLKQPRRGECRTLPWHVQMQLRSDNEDAGGRDLMPPCDDVLRRRHGLEVQAQGHRPGAVVQEGQGEQETEHADGTQQTGLRGRLV